MKTSPKGKKKLNAIKKAVLLSVPLSGIAIIPAGCKATPSPQLLAMKSPKIELVSRYRYPASPPGWVWIAPSKISCNVYRVQEGDTWESLAEKNNTTVYVLLYINQIDSEPLEQIIKTNEIPADWKLHKDMCIYVPAEGQEKELEFLAFSSYYGEEDTPRILLPPKSLREKHNIAVQKMNIHRK